MYLSEGEEIVLSYPVLGPHRIEEDRERGRGHLAERGQLAVYGFLNNIRFDPMISAYSGTIPNFPGHVRLRAFKDVIYNTALWVLKRSTVH